MTYGESLRNELLRKIEHQLTRIADTLEEKNTTAANSDVHIIQVGSTGLEQKAKELHSEVLKLYCTN